MKITFFILYIFIISMFCLNNNIVFAETTIPPLPTQNFSTKEVIPVKLDNPLGTSNPTPQTLIGKVINAVLGIVGSLALLMFIYGGFTWMTAAGNEQSVTKGKDILIWATVGLIVIFSAYALVKFVFTGIGAT